MYLLVMSDFSVFSNLFCAYEYCQLGDILLQEMWLHRFTEHGIDHPVP